MLPATARALVIGAPFLLWGCQGESASITTASALTPAPDLGKNCYDIGDRRACWTTPEIGDERCRQGMCLVERRLPKVPAPDARGYRCGGAGAKRLCEARSGLSGAFVCEGAICRQPHPLMPDAGEWDCQESAGASVCVLRHRAAGVAPLPPHPAFSCARRSAKDEQLVCVDYSPDFPDGRPQAWRCHFENAPTLSRLCSRDTEAHNLADRCDQQRPCVDGALCVQGVCLPRLGTLGCVLDRDCPEADCRFGRCLEAP